VTGVPAMCDSGFCITGAHLSSKRTEGKNLIWSITRYCFLLSGEMFFGYQGMHYFIALVNPMLEWGVISVVGDHGGHT
jgi:dipeptide/tripeptide permease